MTPLQLIEKLELLGLDDSVLGKIREQVEDPDKTVKVSAVLKYLVKKKQITETQARNILKNGNGNGKKKTEKKPAEPKHNTEDLTANFAPPVPVTPPVEQTQLDMGEPLVNYVEEPAEEIQAVALDSAAVIDEGYDYGADAGYVDSEFETETYGAPAGKEVPKSFSGKKDRTNQWLSKWPYIAFFIIGMLLIFGVTLAINVFNQKPEEKFKAAMKHFTDNSYQAAEKGFREYIEDHPTHTYINQAKARRVQCVMAATYATKNWEETIRNGETLLPPILEADENELSLIREDVALMLSRSLDEHTTKLLRVESLPKMEEGVTVALGYKKLVDNPAYVPTSSRKSPTIKRHLDNIDNNIQTVQGSIQKEKDYTAALSSIKTKGDSGETETAFREYQTLTRSYGDLGAREELRNLMLTISEKEQGLVVPANLSLAVSDSAIPSIIENTVVLSSTYGETVDSLRDEVVPFLVDGAVYGFNAGTGAVVWRHFVGFQSNYQPQSYDDESILISDLSSMQLMRVNLKTGGLIWRSEIGEPFLKPSITEGEIVVTTQAGKIMTIDPLAGTALASAKLPQVMSVSPLVAVRDPYIYQPGHYSNIYVLAKEDLSCKEVFYLGHYKGSIVVPPYSYNGFLIVTVNGGDYADMYVLKTDESGLNIQQPVQIIRRVTNGPITTPLQRLGRWLLAVADNGEMQILEFNQGDDQNPIGKVANGKFDNGDGEQAFVTTEGSNLWIAGKGSLRYKIQRSLGQFEFVDIKEHADYFVCPSKKLDDKMFYVRRRNGSGMISASLTDALTLKPIWRTDFGGKLGSEVKRTANGLMAVSNQGDLFSIDGAALKKQYVESTAKASEVVETLKFQDAVQVGENQFAFVGPSGSKDVLLVDGSSVSSKLIQMLPPSDKPACPSIAMNGQLIVANSTGQVARVDTKSGSMVGEPFQPPVRPSEKVLWIRPTPIDKTNFAIASQAGEGSPSVLYLLNVESPRGITSSGSLESSGGYVGELVSDGSSVWVVERTATGDRLLKLAVGTGTPTMSANIELPGKHVAGPWMVGEEVFVHLDTDQLVCVSQNMAIKWKKNMANDRLACPPQDLGQLVLLFESGKMTVVDIADGEDRKMIELGQPVSHRPVVVGQKMFFSGFDGTIHVVDLGSLGVGAPKP